MTGQHHLFASEASLQAAAIDLAAMTGWLCHHTRPARTRDGQWRTPIQGHKGYPDVTFVRARFPQRVVFAEFKSQRGRVTDEQRKWGDALEACAGGVVIYRVWRPSDWPEIQHLLTTGDLPA
ncbi:MAG: hypothetical protein AAF547_06485 [Actinomycetota bacterium]